ncbi:MAG: ABC transporter ATP-binding protein [Lachnospiraceae bacterium]|nr:ABC transporter ATP-binding protein [Lachnospiraceae bacterium]MDD3617539.1 ABC transporter ATP-binding protein [Lachnospiraceae bacterium]
MEQKQKSPLMRIWDLSKSKQGMLKKSIALSAVGVLIGFVPYISAAKIIAMLIAHNGNTKDIVLWALAAFLTNECKTLLLTFSTSVSHKATFAVLAEIRQKCLRKLSNLSMGTLEAQSTGKWKTILVDQIESMEKTIAHVFPEFTGNILGAVVLMVGMIVLDWRLGLLSLVTLPIGMAFMMTTMKGYAQNYEKSIHVGKKMNDAILDYIGGIKVIKAFNQSEISYTKYADSIRNNASFFYGWMKQSQFGMSCFYSISPAVLVIVIPFGLIFYMGGSISVTEFLTILIMAMSVISPIIKMTSYMDSLATTGTLIESVEELLLAPEQHHPQEKVELADQVIELKHVTFAYDDEAGNVLNDVSLRIEPGTKTALVGPSGGGKSTIAKLIAGFWDVEEGSISLGGKDLKDIPLSQISENISYVSQDNFLFDDTVRNNIRMGRENATDEEVEEIARLASCDKFIRKLDRGYDTKVGGGGTHLSGGERQRIAIARAMLKNAPIVILDEATAYIDPENESVLQEAIGNLVKGKTLIVIAHRLATVTNSDKIVVLENGCIKATGTHDELIESSELYRHMWKASTGNGGEQDD